ncbi:LSM7-like protein, partial [Mya arenaria]
DCKLPVRANFDFVITFSIFEKQCQHRVYQNNSSGILKGFDPLLNLVLDDTTEFLRDPDDPYKLTEDTRSLGLVVCRGTSVVLICPSDGMEAIANPFIQQEG